ncbi:MAG: hypothetical protein AVDCRST_MAG42-991, partial [uncultured Chthoniobacterales bacterium]
GQRRRDGTREKGDSRDDGCADGRVHQPRQRAVHSRATEEEAGTGHRDGCAKARV